MIGTFGKNLIFTAIALAKFSGQAATVLWDEDADGSLDVYPYAPTNFTIVVHPVGIATDDVNFVKGSVTLIPTPPGYFVPHEPTFSFYIPHGRLFSGLKVTEAGDSCVFVWGGFWESASGTWDGNERAIGDPYGWFAPNVGGTNDVFAEFGLGVLPSGRYMLNVDPWLPWGCYLPEPGTVHFTMAIYTVSAPPDLQIVLASKDVTLSWPTNNAIGFSLQCSTNLATPAAWFDVTNIPAVVSDRNQVLLPATKASAFFRLKLQ